MELRKDIENICKEVISFSEAEFNCWIEDVEELIKSDKKIKTSTY